jgi:hypothetical protein
MKLNTAFSLIEEGNPKKNSTAVSRKFSKLSLSAVPISDHLLAIGSLHYASEPPFLAV